MTSKPARVFTFDRVTVNVTPANQKIVEWTLDKRFEMDTSYPYFYVEYARAAGEWTRINPDEPVINECFFVDTDKYRCNLNNDVFYRIVAFDGTNEYFSKPQHTLGDLNRRDWRIAREVIRKEYLRLKKYAGNFGYLLKRREHGVRCTECMDHDIDEPVASCCGNCYGTGIKCGYYDGVPYWIDTQGSQTKRDVFLDFAVIDEKNTRGRGVAYPRVDTYDIWVDGDNNKRYVIKSIANAAEIRGVPLVYVLEMQELPASSVEFDIPIQQEGCTVQSSSSVPTTTSGGWRTGINFREI